MFFELPKDEDNNPAALSRITEILEFPGFLGGLVLRAEGDETLRSGRMKFLGGDNPIRRQPGAEKQSLSNWAWSGSVLVDDKPFCTMLSWEELNFASFGFDLIALMEGTYKVGFLSSFYGVGASDFESSVADPTN